MMARTRVVDDDGCVVPPLTDVQGSADQGEERSVFVRPVLRVLGFRDKVCVFGKRT